MGEIERANGGVGKKERERDCKEEVVRGRDK